MARKPALTTDKLKDLGADKLAQLVLDEAERNTGFVLCGCGHNISMILRHLTEILCRLLWLHALLRQRNLAQMAPPGPVHTLAKPA